MFCKHLYSELCDSLAVLYCELCDSLAVRLPSLVSVLTTLSLGFFPSFFLVSYLAALFFHLKSDVSNKIIFSQSLFWIPKLNLAEFCVFCGEEQTDAQLPPAHYYNDYLWPEEIHIPIKHPGTMKGSA